MLDIYGLKTKYVTSLRSERAFQVQIFIKSLDSMSRRYSSTYLNLSSYLQF